MQRSSLFVAVPPIGLPAVLLTAIAAAKAAFPPVPTLAAITFAPILVLPLLSVIA